jgi:hypothetical protein
MKNGSSRKLNMEAEALAKALFSTDEYQWYQEGERRSSPGL